PMMLGHYFPPGMLGIGITALMASFMSGMAGNVTAFNTVWTYDIYQSYIRRNAPDHHYLLMGRVATVAGVAMSVGAAWGLTSGTAPAALHFLAVRRGLVHYLSDMAANFYGAIYAWAACFALTLLISFFTRPRAESDMVGLVYSRAEKPRE